MASHSRFHKLVAKAMFSTREEQESLEFLREFFKKLEKLHWSGCGIKRSGSSRTLFLSLERIPHLLCTTPSHETQ